MFNGNISMKFYDMSHFVRSKGKKTVQRAHCALEPRFARLLLRMSGIRRCMNPLQSPVFPFSGPYQRGHITGSEAGLGVRCGQKLVDGREGRTHCLPGGEKDSGWCSSTKFLLSEGCFWGGSILGEQGWVQQVETCLGDQAHIVLGRWIGLLNDDDMNI